MITNCRGFLTLMRKEIGRTNRVLGQALIAPLVTAALYIFVFGYVLGNNIDVIEGVRYISFVFPGIFTMNLVLTVFNATSFQIYMMKFQKIIEDMLTLPISYTELVLSMIVSGLIRALALSVAISFVAVLFGVNTLVHPFVLIGYILLVSVLFGLIGIIVGVWADNSFEKFGIATNFVLTPLTFLGGAFYSVNMLPESWQFVAHLNPIFYAVDGIRYALTGYHDASIALGVAVLAGLSIASLMICVWIFLTGWKLRS